MANGSNPQQYVREIERETCGHYYCYYWWWMMMMMMMGRSTQRDGFTYFHLLNTAAGAINAPISLSLLPMTNIDRCTSLWRQSRRMHPLLLWCSQDLHKSTQSMEIAMPTMAPYTVDCSNSSSTYWSTLGRRSTMPCPIVSILSTPKCSLPFLDYFFPRVKYCFTNILLRMSRNTTESFHVQGSTKPNQITDLE